MYASKAAKPAGIAIEVWILFVAPDGIKPVSTDESIPVLNE